MKKSFLLLYATSLCLGLVACSPKTTYSITVSAVGEGGKKDITVNLVTEEGKVVASGTTVRGGKVEISAPKSDYSIEVDDLPLGYYQCNEVKTSDGFEYTVELNTQLIKGVKPEKGTRLFQGDVMYDYTFDMADGTKMSISSALDGNEALILNFWGTLCGVCVEEMPYLNAYYEEMKDNKVAVLCVNSYVPDTDETILDFLAVNGYSLPSTSHDSDFDKLLGISGWPTNVVIDRNGRVAGSETGFPSNGSIATFHSLVDKFLGDSYSPAY